MNREIKIRAFNEETRKIDYDGNIGSGSSSREILIDFKGRLTERNRYGLDDGVGITVSKLVIMQFTGLLDKNGKEIYEGDIYCVADNVTYEVRFITDESRETVCGFGLYNPKNKEAFIIDTYAIKFGKVIGNIYENPELLTT